MKSEKSADARANDEVELGVLDSPQDIEKAESALEETEKELASRGSAARRRRELGEPPYFTRDEKGDLVQVDTLEEADPDK